MTTSPISSLPSTAITNSMDQVMFEVHQQSNQRVDLAKHIITDKQNEVGSELQKQIDALNKQVEQQNKSGFWSTLGKIFSFVATIISTALSVLTGRPLALVSAAISIVSSILSTLIKDGIGKAIGIGLQLISAGLALLGQSNKLLPELGPKTAAASTALKYTATGARAASSLTSIPEGAYLAQAARSQSALEVSKYQQHLLEKSIEQEQVAIGTALQSIDKVDNRMLQIQESESRGAS